MQQDSLQHCSKVHNEKVQSIHLMRFPSKAFTLCGPIAATIATVCFSANAQAQSSIDQCISNATNSNPVEIIICNNTDRFLSSSGFVNENGQWPIRDVGARSTRRDGSKPQTGTFSYAANFAIEGTGKFLQLAASSSSMGRKKINVCVGGNPGNGPAQSCLNDMSRDTTSIAVPGLGTVEARVQRSAVGYVWAFFVK